MEKEHIFTRTEMLIGKQAIDRLQKSKVIIFGVGGVGGYVAEALARSAVGTLCLVDNDKVSITNINRQIIALHSSIGRYKVDVAAERIHDINPNCHVETKRMFYLPENADEIDIFQYDYVVDCIDTVKAKLEIARRCHQRNQRLISSMGAANKLNPAGFRVADISKTQIDRLAKVIRKQLRREGINHLKVVFSEEIPMKSPFFEDNPTPASIAFVPSACGLVIAGEVVRELMTDE